jgi:hypothetical protein
MMMFFIMIQPIFQTASQLQLQLLIVQGNTLPKGKTILEVFERRSLNHSSFHFKSLLLASWSTCWPMGTVTTGQYLCPSRMGFADSLATTAINE